MNARNVSRSIAIPSVGTMSCNKGTLGIVRYVGPAAIGANGTVRAVTDVRMACRCPVKDVAGGYEHRSKGRKPENRCAFAYAYRLLTGDSSAAMPSPVSVCVCPSISAWIFSSRVATQVQRWVVGKVRCCAMVGPSAENTPTLPGCVPPSTHGILTGLCDSCCQP